MQLVRRIGWPLPPELVAKKVSSIQGDLGINDTEMIRTLRYYTGRF
jgi:hypothetical protein